MTDDASPRVPGTVADLSDQLQQFDPGTRVMQARDAAGNDYSPTARISVGYYLPDASWSGEFHSDESAGGREFEPGPDHQRAVCISPRY